MRALVVALGLALALPARAEGDVDVAKRAEKRQTSGSVLTAVGALNATLSLASAVAIPLVPSCGYHGGVCYDEIMLITAAASGLVAIPTLAVGLTLRRTGDHDAFAAGQSLPPDFFVERARRRRHVGMPLTAAGAALIAVGAGFGGGAWAALQSPRADLMKPLAATSGAAGAGGLALLSVGAALWSAAR